MCPRTPICWQRRTPSALFNGHPENVAGTLTRLVEMLDESRDPIVIASVIQALGHAWNEEACLSVLRFARHPDEQVRLEVARSAPGGLETDAAAEAVAHVLIELAKDPVDEVRDWATFGLGSILDIDSTQIRDALADRLDDTHVDTSCEALVGLARVRMRERLNGHWSFFNPSRYHGLQSTPHTLLAILDCCQPYGI